MRRAGSSLSVAITPAFWAYAVMGTASIGDSTAPQITMSASPKTICCQACAMAPAPEASAIIGAVTPARADRSNPTAAAGPLGMNIWTARGDTAFRPRLRMSMYARMTSSALPKPVPIDTARRAGSTSGDPPSAHARRPSTRAIFCG